MHDGREVCRMLPYLCRPISAVHGKSLLVTLGPYQKNIVDVFSEIVCRKYPSGRETRGTTDQRCILEYSGANLSSYNETTELFSSEITPDKSRRTLSQLFFTNTRKLLFELLFRFVNRLSPRLSQPNQLFHRPNTRFTQVGLTRKQRRSKTARFPLDLAYSTLGL